MHFERLKTISKICVPSLPKILRPVTRNTRIFLFGLRGPRKTQKASRKYCQVFLYTLLCSDFNGAN